MICHDSDFHLIYFQVPAWILWISIHAPGNCIPQEECIQHAHLPESPEQAELLYNFQIFELL